MEYVLVSNHTNQPCPLKPGDVYYSIAKPNLIESILLDPAVRTEYTWIRFDFDYKATHSTFLMIGSSNPKPPDSDSSFEDEMERIDFLSEMTHYSIISPSDDYNATDGSIPFHDFTIEKIMQLVSPEVIDILSNHGVDLATNDHFYLRMAIAHSSIPTMEALKPHLEPIDSSNYNIIVLLSKRSKKVPPSESVLRLEMFKCLCPMFEDEEKAFNMALKHSILNDNEVALDICKFMIEDMGYLDMDLNSILKSSIENGCFSIAKYLINYGVDIGEVSECTFREYYPPDPIFFRYLIKEGWNLGLSVYKQISNYITVFSIEDLEFFVANGADFSKLNIVTISNRISGGNRFDTVKFLDKLDIGLGSEQLTLLNGFISHDNAEAINFICEAYEGMQYEKQHTLDTCLYYSVGVDKLSMVKLFMEKGAHVFGENKSSLIIALYKSNIEILSYLWENRGDDSIIPPNEIIFGDMCFSPNPNGSVKFHSVLRFITEQMGIDLTINNEELIRFIKRKPINTFVESREYLIERIPGLREDLLDS